jgi:glycosyltransferase involved in cell wall biosynthesis
VDDWESSVNPLKLLFLSTKATRPSHRFRVEQMLPALERRGHRCSVDFFPKNPINRLWLYRQLPQFDAVFIQQRTLDPIELRVVRNLSNRLIFDLDDSVMFDGLGQFHRRRGRRFAAMMRMADLVICGNEFLRDRVYEYAPQSRPNIPVAILPTSINTDRFRPGTHPKNPSAPLTIGWTGSRSSNPYLNSIFPILSQVKVRAELKIISDTTEGLDFSRLGSIPYRFVPWSAETEVAETAEFDIGVMPLPDDNSTRGKCACKALQYMALGIPAICSAVGVNRDIIHDGQNGFLPETPQDWTSTLETLALDADLRQQIGQSGRLTVVSDYSLRETVSRLTELLEQVTLPLKQTA